MVSKHFFLVVFAVSSGVIACGGVDGEGLSEEWVDDGDLPAQSAPTEVEPSGLVAPTPRYPNCGILACPGGTACKFDSSDVPRCTAPEGVTCSMFDCGPYHFCEMTAGGAICVQGTSDG